MLQILRKIFSRGASEDATLKNILCAVPDTRQSANYSCGAAALQAVLRYWGIDIEEDKLMKLLKTSPDYGTNEKDIVRVARRMGLKARFKDNVTLEELERSIHEGIPVIVDCQSWRSGRQLNKSWANNWKNGHYMVVIGIDEDNVYLEDPYVLGSRGYIPRQEFEERWHNPGGTPPSYDERQYHLGIFIEGERPSASGTTRPYKLIKIGDCSRIKAIYAGYGNPASVCQIAFRHGLRCVVVHASLQALLRSPSRA